MGIGGVKPDHEEFFGPEVIRCKPKVPECMPDGHCLGVEHTLFQADRDLCRNIMDYSPFQDFFSHLPVDGEYIAFSNRYNILVKRSFCVRIPETHRVHADLVSDKNLPLISPEFKFEVD